MYMLFLNKIDTNSFVFSFWQNAYFIYLSFYIGLFTHCLFFHSFIQPYSHFCSLFLSLYKFCVIHGINLGLCEFYNKHMSVLGIDRTSFNTHRKKDSKYVSHKRNAMFCALPGTSVGLCELYNTHMHVLGIDRF